MGAVEADKASAVAVLQTLHAYVDVTAEKVKITQDSNGNVHVYATADIPEKTIAFPPCIPRASKVFEKAEHPWAVKIQVQLTETTKKMVKKDQQKVTRNTQLVLMPEFTAPKYKQTQAAVAGSNALPAATAVAGASGAALEAAAVAGTSASAETSTSDKEIQWLWGHGKPESMHPFWAVRRLTAEQLDTERTACIKRNKTAAAGKNENVPSFNCELEEHILSAVCMCVVGDKTANCTKLVKVPVLTNATELATGDELILPITLSPKAKTPAKRTWRDVDKEDAKERKRIEDAKERKRLKEDLADSGEPVSRTRLEEDWSGPP